MLVFLMNPLRVITRPSLGQRMHANSKLSVCGILRLAQIRQVKTRSTVSIKELPQGMIDGDRSIETPANNGPNYPTVIQQARNNMHKFQYCVLLTRVGGFYELYLEHAELYGPLLGLKLAHKKTVAGPVAMAGFPFFQLDRFLRILVQDNNMCVAISEEFPNDVSSRAKSGGLLFDRKVARVITPGTLVDEKFINPHKNNFLLALHPQLSEAPHQDEDGFEGSFHSASSSFFDKSIGAAWLDLSTGEFFTQTIRATELPSITARIGAQEVILSNNLQTGPRQLMKNHIESTTNVVTWQYDHVSPPSISEWAPMLETAVHTSNYKSFSPHEVFAGSLLLHYVRDRLQGLEMKLQGPFRLQGNDCMIIDRTTLNGLEILETSKDAVTGGKGSLLHTIKRTVTSSGTRLLRQRISSPSTCLPVINQRLELVECLLAHPELRENISSFLKRTTDSPRILQKLSLGRGDADDLFDLHKTIMCTSAIASTIEQLDSTPKSSGNALKLISRRFSLDGSVNLAKEIRDAIDEESLMARRTMEDNEAAVIVSTTENFKIHSTLIGEGEGVMESGASKSIVNEALDLEPEGKGTWIMKRSASETNSRLHESLDKFLSDKGKLTISLRHRLSAASLTLRWTPGLGHFCHIKGTRDIKALRDAVASIKNASISRSTQSFYHEEWSDLGAKIDQIKFQVTVEEQSVLRGLKERALRMIGTLRNNAAILDELDVACSSAVFATEQGLTKPLLNEGSSHLIVSGRHPSVQIGLEERGRTFVANDCLVGGDERIWLITGPNMAGKSTFLRQNALISILAQIGSYVPADYAEMGLVDKIFSRIGAADSLFQNQSTFMVEMLETAAILRSATPRSFVIMDEVGRGTTPDDGVAVGYACLHHLCHVNRCRTLFATHFHQLADMTKEWAELGSYCNDVEEDKDGSFNFVHSLRRGVNRESHALKVAQLAGLPSAALKVARQVIENLRSGSE